MTVAAFSSPGVEFGPLVLARPLWALLLLHSWQLIGQNRRNAWFAWSIEAGLLLLTTSAAPVPVAAARRICARDRARTAHADVVRSAVRAARDRRAGAALSDLADPRRRARVAAMAGDRRISARRALQWGCAARRPAAGDIRHRAAGVLNSGWFARNAGRGADHLPAAGRSAGARFRLFLRHRPRAARKPDLRAVRFRSRRGRGGRRAC